MAAVLALASVAAPARAQDVPPPPPVAPQPPLPPPATEPEPEPETEPEAPTAPLPPPRWDDVPATTTAPAPAVDLRRLRKACETRREPCDWMALLGTLERAAVERSLAENRLEVEPSPWGKKLRRIVAANHDVFGPKDGFLQWFNVFHFTTKSEAVEREVLLRPGDGWDQDLVDETARKLRDPLFSSVVALVPVRSPEPGTVDILVVTRDIWSLRFNSNYELQDGRLTYLTLSLSENNLFGRRKLLAAVFEMDQGAYSFGPLYIDKNLLGRHYNLHLRGGALFNRESSEYEGSASTVTFARPLWSLNSEWGYGVEWSHRYAIDRAFRREGIRLYDAPSTEAVEMIPYQYRQRRWAVDSHIVRGFGERVEQRIRLGHEVQTQRPETFGLGAIPDEVRDEFAHDVLPRSERTSMVYVGYELFTPRYRAVRNIVTFDLAEDLRFGPELTTKFGTGLKAVGSEETFGKVYGLGGWSLPLGDDGVVHAAAEIEMRLQDGDLIDNKASGVVRVVTPTLAIGRVVTEIGATTLWNDQQNRFVTLGGDNGLRGFPINEFEGQRRVNGQVEFRSLPVRVLIARLGLVAFYDAGGAHELFRDMPLNHNLGIGLRSLIPQLSPELFRVDCAFALNGEERFKPRIIAGYRQAF